MPRVPAPTLGALLGACSCCLLWWISAWDQVAEVVEGGGGVSILGDAQKLPGHGVGHSSGWPCWSGVAPGDLQRSMLASTILSPCFPCLPLGHYILVLLFPSNGALTHLFEVLGGGWGHGWILLRCGSCRRFCCGIGPMQGLLCGAVWCGLSIPILTMLPDNSCPYLAELASWRTWLLPRRRRCLPWPRDGSTSSAMLHHWSIPSLGMGTAATLILAQNHAA